MQPTTAFAISHTRAPQHPRPAAAAPRCGRAPLQSHSVHLRPFAAADTPRCPSGCLGARGALLRCLGLPVLRHGKLTEPFKGLHTPSVPVTVPWFSSIQFAGRAYNLPSEHTICSMKFMLAVLVLYATGQKIQARCVRRPTRIVLKRHRAYVLVAGVL